MNKEADEDVYVALRDAFDAARRALEEDVQRHRGQIRSGESPAEGPSS